ncbi:MAG: amidohydrolase family protein, partial [Brachybacterium sp.]|nr:amidohydrolase family protein [Brachybacterium sp.]
MLIRQVRPFDAATGEAPDVPVDLRIHDGVITEIAPDRSPAPGEEVLEGEGALAIPGLWDRHVHTGQLAQAHARLDTGGAGSVGVILELVRAELAARRDAGMMDQALVGFGHRLVDFAVQPTVPALDEATGSVPTVLIGGDAHHAWLNSAALRLLALPPRDGIVA